MQETGARGNANIILDEIIISDFELRRDSLLSLASASKSARSGL